MKTKYLYIIALFFIGLISCDKDDDLVVAHSPVPPELMISNSTIVLLEEQAEKEAINFTRTSTDFGFDGAESYEIQFDTVSNFASNMTPIEFDTTMKISYSVATFNSRSVQLGLTPNEVNTLYVRLKASVSEDVFVYSNIIELSVTPYQSSEVSAYADLYMIGPATEIGWGAASDAIPMFRDPENSFVYTFTGNFNEGELKLLGERGNWQPQWGSAMGSGGSGKLALQETSNDSQPPGITMTAGYQTITVNIQTMTYTIESYDVNSSPVYSSAGLSGSLFNDWTDIVPMTNSSFNPHIWTLNYDYDEYSDIQFRAGSEWWGTVGDQSALYGTARESAQNIWLNGGSYLVVFNDLTGEYIFIK
ncbi:SusE domain-containing protein [Fulvivirga sediminis]|uniref:SusE domain-containing protein n=1 Tax=Fulvivirga sediminis TaxID=2803949 RepID=A0A937F5D9_9BACT|nr:SusE domain-containing protein [Fulvivirga sediminis]MBL3655252.1 SusE domain-containing protein [Fulvivirga sediminis]